MSTPAAAHFVGGIRSCYRPLILAGATLTLLCLFWFAARYLQLISKARHVGQALPSMAFSHEALQVAPDAPAWRRIVVSAVNWLDSMKVGMTFGVMFGALLHTILRYYPVRSGGNVYLNSLKGALAGVPMGVCANCAVPVVCGVTRGRGRVEMALGFLFSSPNFNPVVLMMTLVAFPLAMSITKYAVLLLVILVVVPVLVARLERAAAASVQLPDGAQAPCVLPPLPNNSAVSFLGVFRELAADFVRHGWMLVKPTVVLMLLASVLSAAALTLIPWSALLSEVTPLRLGLVGLGAVFMPVPIALDAMFAAQLQRQGVAPAYVMLFLMTLGTYSILPSIYLWREVSRTFAAALFIFFLATGWLTALLF